MSMESAKKFLLYVESDPDILNDISQSINNAKTDDEKIDMLVSFAQSIGYDFNAYEIKVVSSEIGNVGDNSCEVYGGKFDFKNMNIPKIKFLGNDKKGS